MTTTDYLINILFVFIVFRQAHERRIDRRYFVLPLVLVAWVATQYVHALPTAGNDLVLIAALACVGLTFGAVSGLATTSGATVTATPLPASAGWRGSC